MEKNLARASHGSTSGFFRMLRETICDCLGETTFQRIVTTMQSMNKFGRIARSDIEHFELKQKRNVQTDGQTFSSIQLNKRQTYRRTKLQTNIQAAIHTNKST